MDLYRYSTYEMGRIQHHSIADDCTCIYHQWCNGHLSIGLCVYHYEPGYPAAHADEFGLAVGAYNSSGYTSDFSNWAGNIVLDYVEAPGENIYSAQMGGGYQYLDGTSMATPHVAGIAALLLSYNNNLTPQQVEEYITSTASNSLSASSTAQSNSIDSLTGQPLNGITNESLHLWES